MMVVISVSRGKESCGIIMVSHTQPSCTQTQNTQDAAVLALSLRANMLKRAQRQTKTKCYRTKLPHKHCSEIIPVNCVLHNAAYMLSPLMFPI